MNQQPDQSKENENEPNKEVNLSALPESLQKAVAQAGWSELMPVQKRSIPYLLEGRDMMVQARTGSGKTGAYLLPMLSRLDAKKNLTQALVLVPTRELAKQVTQQAGILLKPAGLRSVAVYGGVGYKNQIDALKGGVQVVIGKKAVEVTPG